MAKYYAKNKPKYTTHIIFFSGEEIGLLGSTAFVADHVFDFKRIKFLLNIDLMGTGENGIQIVNSIQYPKAYQTLVSINREKGGLLKQLKKLGPVTTLNYNNYL